MNNIKKLYSQVLDKKALVTLVAKEFGRPETSVRSNWFGTGSLPDYLAHCRKENQGANKPEKELTEDYKVDKISFAHQWTNTCVPIIDIMLIKKD